MGPDFTENLILSIFSALFGLFVGVLVGEPLKRAWTSWLDTRVRIRGVLRPRLKFKIIQLHDPELPPFDYSKLFKELNAHQSMFVFEVEELLRAPYHEEIAGLKAASGKREFVEQVAKFLSAARRAPWTGLLDTPPQKRFQGCRDLVVTDVPLPGNFYGWNSMDRTLLIISTAPTQYVLPPGGVLTAEDFVTRITQRMAVFAIAPSLNPRRDHVRTSVGCLFDFTLLLSRVTEILETCIICTDCCRLIARDRGNEFALRVRDWVESRSVAHVTGSKASVRGCAP